MERRAKGGVTEGRRRGDGRRQQERSAKSDQRESKRILKQVRLLRHLSFFLPVHLYHGSIIKQILKTHKKEV